MESQTATLRILLLDDHVLFRDSLCRLLSGEDGIEIAGQCGTNAEALEIVARDRVHVVLLDLDLGAERGNSFMRQARDQGFDGRVLVLTAHASDAEAVELIRSGVSGIFLKHGSPDQLLQAIRKIGAGESWLDGPYVEALIRATAGPAGARPAERFTERERQVLRGVVEGLANKEIGDRLHVSESSVKSSLQQLFRKTGVRTRAQLVRVALERKLDLG
jgi:DNA-binding NarL/FixJ family response regulator